MPKVKIIAPIVIALLAASLGAWWFVSRSSAEFPDVAVRDLTGVKVSSHVGLGRGNEIAVIVFWAPWCKMCIERLDELSAVNARWMAEHRTKVTAISTDDAAPGTSVANVLRNKGWPFTTLIDRDGALSGRLKLQSVPTVILVDPKGSILREQSSFGPGDVSRLEADIRSIKTR